MLSVCSDQEKLNLEKSSKLPQLLSCCVQLVLSSEPADKKSNITGYVPPPPPPSHGQIYYYNRPLTAQNGPVQLQIGFLQRFANNEISENKKVYLRSIF